MQTRTPHRSLLAAVFTLGCCAWSAWPYRGPPGEHFDGEQFHNEDPTAVHSPSDLLRFFRERERPEWVDMSDAPPGPL